MSNRVLAGAFEGTYVLRVSRPGWNVLDPGLPSRALTFDSRWATFAAVHTHGQLSFPFVDINPPEYNGQQPVMQQVWHGLGFVPFVFAFMIFNSDGRMFPAGGGGEGIELRADGAWLYATDRQGMGGTLKYAVTRTPV